MNICHRFSRSTCAYYRNVVVAHWKPFSHELQMLDYCPKFCMRGNKCKLVPLLLEIGGCVGAIRSTETTSRSYPILRTAAVSPIT